MPAARRKNDVAYPMPAAILNVGQHADPELRALPAAVWLCTWSGKVFALAGVRTRLGQKLVRAQMSMFMTASIWYECAVRKSSKYPVTRVGEVGTERASKRKFRPSSIHSWPSASGPLASRRLVTGVKHGADVLRSRP